MTALFLIGGLVLLTVGAEALVRGASRLAKAVGISPLVIGLTVVAYGTSAPEMAVSVISGLSGNSDIALGNVVGSNTFNVLFILGISALITPLVVSSQLVRLDVPVMIAASLLTILLGADGRIGRIEGALLFAFIVAYTAFLVYQGWKESGTDGKKPALPEQENDSEKGPLRDIGLVLAGLGLLVLGSNWLVKGAVSIAQHLGVSELIIGLTIVAAGTSLPEVATSIVASIRGERDIAIGNVVGSNIFNILAVLGLSASVSTEGIAVSAAALRVDIPVMIGVAILCFPIFVSGNIISRVEGGLFLGYYAVYTAYLILVATHEDWLPWLGRGVLWVLIPLTMLVLVSSFRGSAREA